MRSDANPGVCHRCQLSPYQEKDIGIRNPLRLLNRVKVLNSRFCHFEKIYFRVKPSFTGPFIGRRKRKMHHQEAKRCPLSPMPPFRCALLVSYLPLLFLACQALSSMSMSAGSPKHVLFDVNVSNNGARVRLILYKASALWLRM